MKKLTLTLLLALIMVLLSGCFRGLLMDDTKEHGDNTHSEIFAGDYYEKSDSSDTTTKESSASQESSAESSKSSSVAQSSANSSKPTTLPIQTMKYYISDYNGTSLEEYIPRLMLKNDGTFILVENLYEGMGEYSGTYKIAKDHLVLSVKNIDFMGFKGDDLKTIDFTINNKNQLTLNTDLCASWKGSIFSIKS